MFKFFSSVFVAQASGALLPHLSDHGADVTSTPVASSISTSTGTVVNTSSKLPVEWVYITEYTTVYPTPSSITASSSAQDIQNTTRLHRPKLSAYVSELLSGAQQSAYASSPAGSETSLLSVTFTTPYLPLNTACLTYGPGLPASASSRSSTSLGSSLRETSSHSEQSTQNWASGQAGTPATSNSALCPDYSFASQSLSVYPNITSGITTPSSLAPIALLTSSAPPSSAPTPTILNSSQTPNPINILSPPAMPSESAPAVVIVPITLTPPLPFALAYPALQKRHNSDDDEPEDAPSDDTTVTSTTTRKTTITVSSVTFSARPTLTTQSSRPSNRPQTLPSSSSSSAAVVTSLVPPDARCPYPYPGVQCAQRTTLVTKPTSTSTKAKETTKWCPYPGHVCLTTWC